jgi:hypothetical protein
VLNVVVPKVVLQSPRVLAVIGGFEPAGMATHVRMHLHGGLCSGLSNADPQARYHISEWYRPEAARGLRWDDPHLATFWPTIAQRDLQPGPGYAETAGPIIKIFSRRCIRGAIVTRAFMIASRARATTSALAT